jgi:hypothetical protein
MEWPSQMVAAKLSPLDKQAAGWHHVPQGSVEMIRWLHSGGQ